MTKLRFVYLWQYSDQNMTKSLSRPGEEIWVYSIYCAGDGPAAHLLPSPPEARPGLARGAGLYSCHVVASSYVHLRQ